MFTISIIIPVYNAEATIDRCLRSLGEQGLEDYEVILVNDGSSDGSEALCRLWCERDKRYRLISQVNLGPSAARNAGLDVAKGEFICFIDSDDYLSPNTLSANLEYFTRHPEISLIQFPMIAHYDDGRVIEKKQDEQIISSTYEINEMWCKSCDLINGFFGGKIYRNSLLEGVRLPVGMWNSEDSWLLCEILPKCTGLLISNRGAYNYEIHQGSLSCAVGQEQQERHARNNIGVLVRKVENAYFLRLSDTSQISSYAYCVTSIANYVIHNNIPIEIFGDSIEKLNTHPLSLSKAIFSKVALKAKLKILLIMLFGIRSYIRLLKRVSGK